MNTLKISVIKERRKSIRAFFDGDNIVIKAPSFVSKGIIESFINENGGFFLKVIEAKRELKKGVLPFLGFKRRVEELHRFVYGSFNASTSSAPSREYIKELLKEAAKRVIIPRFLERASVSNLDFKSVDIGLATSRYGSCTGCAKIRFSAFLVLMPIEAIDYVIAHELAHLKVMNHSERFWREVERIYPDYLTGRTLLSKNAYLMYLLK